MSSGYTRHGRVLILPRSRLSCLVLFVARRSSACSDCPLDAHGCGGDDGRGVRRRGARVRDRDRIARSAAAKCCDCPTFAAPKTDPAINACAGVTCPVPTCPRTSQPACNARRAACSRARDAVRRMSCARRLRRRRERLLDVRVRAGREPRRAPPTATAPRRRPIAAAARSAARDTAVPAAAAGALRGRPRLPGEPVVPGRRHLRRRPTRPACVQGALRSWSRRLPAERLRPGRSARLRRRARSARSTPMPRRPPKASVCVVPDAP